MGVFVVMAVGVVVGVFVVMAVGVFVGVFVVMAVSVVVGVVNLMGMRLNMVMQSLAGVIGIIQTHLLLSMDGNSEMGPGDPALNSLFQTDLNTGQAEGAELIQESLRVREQFQQSGGEHIPGGAHTAVKVKDFHKKRLLSGHMVYHSSKVARAEAVINIDNRDAACAGIEHREQSGKAMEGRAITHAGRHGNHGTVGKSSEHTGQRALHPGHGDDHAGAHNYVQMGKGPVQSRHAHVIKPDDLIPKDLRGKGGLFRNGQIACAACSNHNGPQSIRRGHVPHNPNSRIREVIHWVPVFYEFRGVRRHPGNQERPVPVIPQDVQNPADLFGSFPRAIDDLCRALPGFAMEVYFCITDVLKGLHFDFQQSVVHGQSSVLNALQDFPNLTVHRAPPNPSELP